MKEETQSYIDDNNPVRGYLMKTYTITNNDEDRVSVDSFYEGFTYEHPGISKRKMGNLMMMMKMRSRPLHGVRYYYGIKEVAFVEADQN